MRSVTHVIHGRLGRPSVTTIDPGGPLNRSHLVRRGGALVAALASLLLLVTAATPAGASTLPVTYNVSSALPSVLQPNKSPAGSNNWSCKPSAAHPQPVVLVEGTFATMGENWGTLSPLLANNGYCVYAFNYGSTIVSTLTGGNIQAIGPVATSAGQLSTFVNKVLASTGAGQVDLVGHSQGGMMPNYYIKFLGGAPKVHTFVALAPDNHGTTLDGLVTFGDDLGVVFPLLLPSINLALDFGQLPGLTDQETGSAFIKKLNSVPDTVAGINYTVIATKYDEVVTPYTSDFLTGPNVNNILLQNQCSKDGAEHIAIAFDHIALRDVLNALDPAHAVAPTCSTVLPLVGG
jgi:triacylglycerol esterase/lipase EstA (alpha/beta hydrolase family)